MIGDSHVPNSVEGIAIIGMAGRFPGAQDIHEFWNNLKAGVESISFFSDDELAASGVDVASVKDNSNYVRAGGVVPKADLFDAAFFGVSPREAELMDPQHRLLLESSWVALEHAGYDAESYAGSVGVYAGMNKTSYLLSNLYPNGNTISALGPNQTELANERDYLTTRISYKLNLKGPSLSVQTACSTSLVAIVVAYQGLLNYQCDMALAGGVCVRVPQKQGYWYEETGVASPDGHCRPFDERAQGTVGGSGVGVVVLKRLAEALADGDTIYAVIKGMAINNDGAAKLSYTAPSVDGQAEVIAMAQAVAGVDPGTVSYIECHGTGTPLGDPIEIAGLTQAFRAGTDARAFCAIGSVKSNLGHLDAAAGVAGLIKTVLALQHKLLPPSLHYEKPNPKCNFADTPFYVNAKLTEWKTGYTPRRAGVSSFGFGGTNAHAVLEEAPPVAPSGESRPWQILRLSAKTNTALEAATANLARYFKDNPDCNLADAAYTLNVGRRGFDNRRILVCRDLNDAVSVLETLDPRRVITWSQERRNIPVVFMFPGQGSQYVNMGRELYHGEPVFRQELDRCAALLAPHLGYDLLQVLYPDEAQVEEATERLTQTAVAQPAIFAIEYALAKLWMEWDIRPEMMIGHSVGEFVAACLAGVFSLKDALALVAARGRLIQALPAGAMLAVPLAEKEVSRLLGKDLALAAINGPANCVVSGSTEAVDVLERQLAKREIATRHLHTSHAFHSTMVDPILGKFMEEVRKIKLNPPEISFISSMTGTWITPEEAAEPSYWVNQLRQKVRFSEGLAVLLEEPHRVLLEVGPGQTLSTFSRQHPALGVEHTVLPTLRHPHEKTSDVAFLLNSLGRLWLAGAEVGWSKVYALERRHRIPLPTYPFERRRFWIDPPRSDKQQTILSSPFEQSLNGNVAASGAQDLTPRGGSEEVAPTPQPSVIPVPPANRKLRILVELINITHELRGIDVADLDVNATFLELGFDSLFLTQANAEFRKQFNVRITFRQLLDEASTLDALAQFIDNNLPPEAFPEEISQLPVVSRPPPVSSARQQTGGATSSAPGQEFAQATAQLTEAAAQLPSSASALERIYQQLQVMSQQVALLRDGDTSAAVQPPQTAHPGQSVPAGQTAKEPVPQLRRPGEPKVAGVPNRPQFSELKPQRFGPWKPIDQSSFQGLDSRQKRHLDDLISRYTARTWKSKQLTQAHRRHLADPRAVAGFRTAWKEMVYPIVSARSSGSKIWDIDGNEYVDVTMGFGANLLGHSPPFVIRAAEEQLKLGVEVGPQSRLAGDVAKMICEFTGMERVTFCNTGSEAVMAALRVARTVTGRNKVVFFSGDYHGIFDEVLSRPSTKHGKLGAVPIAPGIPAENLGNVMVLEYGNPASLQTLRDQLPEIAAVLVEPVQARHPDLQPKEFLQELRRITEESDTALIFDEVITGFRIHPGGAQAWFGIRADLATYGKVVGGGMPIGILAGKATLMDALDGGMWSYGDNSFPEVGVTFFAGTFVRHPLALATASSVLNHLKEAGPELQQRLNDKANRFARDLNEHFESIRVPIHIQHCGSIFHLEFLEELRFSSLLFFHLREKGVHVWEGRPFFISTAHTDEDLALIAGAIRESVAEMQAAGYLPAPRKAVEQKLAGDVEAVSSLPLTAVQRELWLAAQMGSEASSAFIDSVALHLRGPLRTAALLKAIDELVARHDSLRTRFDESGESQQVLRTLPLDVPLSDLSDLEPNEAQQRFAEIGTKESRKPFDLSRAPLLRAHLVKLKDQHHALLLTTHHIVVDGWSLGVLLSELGIIYSAQCRGEAHGLPAPMQYANYVQWESTPQQSGERAASEAYWLEQFTGSVPVLELPTDRPRTMVKTYSGAVEQIVFTSSLCQDLRRLAARRGSTLFAMLLAGFNLLLHRLTEHEDIVIGVPVAGQLALNAPDLVGHCVNFLPLRNRIKGDTPFFDHLAAVQSLVLDAYDHQSYTYFSLLQKLRLPRDPSRLPLVAVSFNLDKVGARPEFDSLDVELSVQPKGAINFDIEIDVVEEGGGLRVNWHYNTDLFDAETIGRWLRHFQSLLDGIVSVPERRLAEFPLLTATERQEMLRKPPSRNTRPTPTLVQERLEVEGERAPESPAVIFAGQQLTYRELNDRSNQLAHYLQRLGVGPETRVGLCMERSLEMIVGILGVLKAGGAYVPLDPAYPKQGLSFMVEDAQLTLILTQERMLARLDDDSTESLGFKMPAQVVLDRDWDRVAESPRIPASSVCPDTLAYVIYTSGSTGRPKGVMISHRALASCIESVGPAFEIEPGDRVLQFASISFDVSVEEIFASLTRGATLVLGTESMIESPQGFLEQCRLLSVSVLDLPTAYWHELVVALGRQGLVFPDCLRLVIIGGERARPGDVALWADCGPSWVRLVNGYGPTEATITATLCELSGGFATHRQAGEVPIGRPLAHVQAWVLDDRLEPVPIGVAGELYLGGDSIARGYLSSPDLTAEKFIPNPHGDPGTRLYRTGDRVQCLRNSQFVFLGRIDNQVKIRGFRIECGEIESVLNTHTAVREAVVVARETGLGEKQLVAYIVPASQRKMLITELRELLRRKLPGYMVPSAFVMMEKLPMTPNGKVDRRALPSPEHSRPELESTFVAPRTAMERSLTAVWGEVLKLERVGIRDNFFDLGGHSLLATQLLSRVRKTFQVELPLRVLFEFPTIEGLALAVVDAREPTRKSKATHKYSSLIPFQTGGSTPPCFLYGVSFELCRHLGLHQPSYALVPHGYDGRQAPDTVEEMAANYLREIRAVQPKGPYFIGGHSFGGIVAFEMAQQLHRQGQSVGLLVLLDPTTPSGVDSIVATVPQNPSSKSKDCLDGFVHRLQSLKQLSLPQQGRYILNWLKWRGEQVRKEFKMMVCKLHHYAGFRVPPSLRMFYFTEVSLMAVQRYIPKLYPGRLIVLKSQEGVDDSQAIWTRLTCGGVELHELPGKHFDPIRGLFVKDWGRQLRDCLVTAQGRMSKPVPPLSESRSA